MTHHLQIGYMRDPEARNQALAAEFLQATAALRQTQGDGVALWQIGGRMESMPVFDGTTYLGRSGVVEKMLVYAGVKTGIINVANDILPPVRDRLVESGRIETAVEAPAIQLDGHPQHLLHSLVELEPVTSPA